MATLSSSSVNPRSFYLISVRFTLSVQFSIPHLRTIEFELPNMPNAFSLAPIIVGIAIGVIAFGASVFYYSSTNAHSYSDGRKKKVIRCFICHKDTAPLRFLLCGHIIHDLCLYETLILCKVFELKKYKCRSCSELVPHSFIRAVLRSRCCVCKNEFDSNTHTLTCGHRLHYTCLDANKRMQLAKKRIMYKCPYNLLECDNEMAFHTIPNFTLNTIPNFNFGCFKCKKNTPPFQFLLCGHQVHDCCLYELLIGCTVSELKKYKCRSCSELVPHSFIRAVLRSRCCVCKNEFDSNTYTLTCGHRLHYTCLDANKRMQLAKKRIMYKCPYNLLECDNEMAFNTIPNFNFGCFKCKKNTPPFQFLLCGHQVHDCCLYELLIGCTVSELKKYKCPSCSKLVPYSSYISKILCSRCCVCKKEFDSNTSVLTCGHRLHKTCLEDNVRMQLMYKKTTFKCPYSLLECSEEIAINAIPNFNIRHLYK